MSGPDTAGAGDLLLAIDTSTSAAGLALYAAGILLAETQWPAGRAQTATLLDEVDRLFRLSGKTVDDLRAVAVATGPGSFNSLRVGLSVAKGLAFALDIPLLAVPTLDAAAYPHLAGGRPVRAVLAAGRGRLVSALYRWHEGGSPHRVGDYANSTLSELAASIVEPTLVCGELDAVASARLAELAPAVQVASPALRLRRAACLAELAWRRLSRGERDDLAGVEPLYLHGPAGGATVRASSSVSASGPVG